MKQLLLFLSMILSLGIMYGQSTPEEAKKHINKIKKSQMYLSAEATLSEKEEALKTANELLVDEINSWVKTKRNSDKIQQIVLQDISSCSEAINMKRGTNFRVFVYVKKSDIVLIKGEGQLILNDNEKGSELQALSEITEPMRIEKPSPQKPQSTVERIVGNNKETSLKRITSIKTMGEMKQVFGELKADDAITYGSYPSDGLPEHYYLLFYNRAGDIKSILSVEGENILDIATQQPTKLSTFSGHGAYWFQLK